MVVFPWLKTPRDPYWIRSASYLFLLHNLCLLPIALLHAPSEWMNPIYVAGATNIFLLAYTANKLPWQHLTRPWIYASGLAILPSLVGLIVWDPVHGWMAGAGMVVLIGAYLAMALIHHHRISRFGEVKAQLLSTSAVRCERVSLLIEVTPPRSLELEEVRATLTCLRIVHQGGGRGGSSRHVEVHSEHPMKGEWPLKLPAGRPSLLVMDGIVPPDALLTEKDEQLGEIFWEVRASIKAANGPTWVTELPMEVVH
jgi:hypothetical protein